MQMQLTPYMNFPVSGLLVNIIHYEEQTYPLNVSRERTLGFLVDLSPSES